MKKNVKSITQLFLATALCAGLVSGCSGAGANNDVAKSTATATASPTVVAPVSVLTPGTGPAVKGSGAVSTELKVWGDKFDGQPFGRGSMTVTLVPEETELPGLLAAIQDMKEGEVGRLEIPAKDLFADIPPGAGIQPDKKFFIEVKVAEVFPEEPFEITTVKEGSGEKVAAKGDAVKVHYVGRLDNFDDGKVFDSSRERNTPFPVVLGNGQVIPGWEKGLEGMKKGETRRLSIPHYMAYGDQAQGDIPPKSRLFFEIELLDFIKPGKLVQTTTKPGKGEAIQKGQVGNFHYTGWSDGFDGKEKFDSSLDRKEPIKVKLGAGQVIEGWDQGLVGMKPGEVRRLEIPYNLAYGEQGKPPTIGAYATLYFEVQYVGPAE